MTVFSAITTLRDKTAAERLADGIEMMDPEPSAVGVIEIEDGSGTWEVSAYFEAAPNTSQLKMLADVFGAKAFVTSEVPQKDWVAEVRRELTPVNARRFFVYGSHDAENVPNDKISLLIEASMAFGTGHHGTTQGCLEAIDALASTNFNPDSVADIGCGTAVLAMAARHVWPATTIASDIDIVATDTAQANLVANDLDTQIEVITCAGFDHPRFDEVSGFDLIIANILKGPLLALASDMAEHATTNGYAILSGILNEQADEVIDWFAKVGFELCDRRKLGDWTTLTLQKSAVSE